MKTFLKVLLTLAILAGLGYGGWYAYNTYLAQTPQEGTVYVQSVSVITGVGPAGQRNRYSGVVEAKNVVKLDPDKDLTVKECFVAAGDKVVKGQRLFSYDVESMQIAFEQLQLDILGLENGIQTGEAKVESLKKKLATVKEFKKGIADLREQGMKQLIFDLRGNTGGYLAAAVDIADEFLPKGSLIVYTEGRNRPRQYMNARRRGMLEDMPVVVLIDGESASASEIVAGALQDNDRGTIIGRRSFGKGLVQEQIMLSDESAIRLTVARYYTPTGRCIQKPYSGNKEEYLLESYDRYENGELFHPDSIHFADSLKFTTPKGKTVYGGGGIMPDIYVPLVDDSTEYYFNRIVNKGLLYQYAFEYTDQHRVQLQRYKTVEAFDQGFKVTDAMFDELVKRAGEKGIKGTEEQQLVARREADILLKAYIARDLFDDAGFYPIYAPMDEVLQKAIEQLQTSVR